MSMLIADIYNDTLYYPLSESEYIVFFCASERNARIYKKLRSNPQDIIDSLAKTINQELKFEPPAPYLTVSDIRVINDNVNNLHANIDQIFSNVWCPFADRRKHWFHSFTRLASEPSSEESISVVLSHFLENYHVLEMEGLYMLIDNADVATDRDLSRQTLLFFELIRQQLNPKVLDGIQQRNWRFRLGEEELYLLVFSNHYPKNHSRYIPVKNSIAFLIQPDRVFDKFANAETMLIKQNVRQQIRTIYCLQGVEYNYSLSESNDHKRKFVKSTDLQSIIKWWDF